MSQLYGVDVSEFQGEINWDELNAVANFVIIRASFGTDRKDNQFDRNQSEARRVQASAGPLGIGYYYFAYPTLIDAVTSANYFVENLGSLQPGEVLFLDLEGNVGSDPVGWAHAFLDRVHVLTNQKPLIYLNQALVNEHNWSPVIEAGFGLWLADYDGNKTGPGVATPWSVTAVRQWTDADTVAGISGKVDGDVFYGDFSQWYSYGKPSPLVATTPSPVPSTPPAVVQQPPTSASSENPPITSSIPQPPAVPKPVQDVPDPKVVQTTTPEVKAPPTPLKTRQNGNGLFSWLKNILRKLHILT